MITLSQRDVRWRDKLIGQSRETIGQSGCTITCLSMLSDYYFGLKNPPDEYLRPDFLAEKLLFTPDGLVYWKSVNSVCPFEFAWRYYTRDDYVILGALENPVRSVILRVNFSNYSSVNKHWLVATGISSLGLKMGGFTVADPWTGKRSSAGGILSKYRTIDGMATFTGK